MVCDCALDNYVSRVCKCTLFRVCECTCMYRHACKCEFVCVHMCKCVSEIACLM